MSLNIDNPFDLYPDPARDSNASHPATTTLLAAFALYLKPKLVVEAGTYHGRTSITLAKVLRTCNVEFHIHTAEILPNFIAIARENIERNGVAEHITIHEGDYLDMLAGLAGAIDFAYIDGGVRWPMIEATLPKMDRQGFIFVDDTATVWGDRSGYDSTLAAAGIRLHGNRGLAIIAAEDHVRS